MIFSSGPILINSLYTVVHMRQIGYATTMQAIKAATAVISGQVLVGPGATLLAVWFWREGKLLL